MKKIYTLIYLIILYFNGLAQITKSNSSITGIVYDSLSLQPLPNANLWLFNTKFGTTTDKNGYFILSDLPKGNYTLKINFLGYKSFQKQIFLKENQQLNLKIYLTDSILTTQTITISSYKSDKSNNLGRVNIISQEKIQMNPAINISGIIDYIPGVNVNNTTSIFSTKTVVSIHGLPTNDQSRTLVILDGITLNKSDLGSVNWNLINKNNIEKIKVIKGPGPAKYGSNAMGGVIEITSKKISEKLSGEISASYGSYNTMSLNTLISNSKKYNNNTFYYSLSGTGQRSDGYITEPKQFIETADSIIIPVFFKELNTNLKSGCIINNKHNFEAQFNYFDDIRSTGIKVFENKGAHSKHTTYNAYLKYSNYENSKIKYNIVAFYSSEFYNRLYEYLKEGEYMLYLADVIREDKGINIDIDLNYSKIHNISGGFNYKNGNVKGSDIYYTSSDKVNNSGNIDNVALYIQDEINFNKKLILNAGIRYDIAQFTKGLFNIENPSYTLIFYKNFENENIKSKYWNTINPRINLEYKLSEKFNTYISFAKGFKTPLLDDMCRTGKQKNRFKIANPNLTPEHLYVYETGIDYNFKNITTSISAYYSIGKDFMYYASTGDTVNMGYKLAPIMMKQNIGKVEIYGCETEIKYDLKNFLLIYANHTYTHSKIIQHKINTASDSSLTGKYLTDIPIHKISSGIIWKNNILNVSLLYKYTGKIWINDLNTIDEYLLTNKLPDYSIYSIKFYKAFKNRYEIEINIENIFNKIIIDSNLQRNPGRFVTTLFRFKF